METVRILTVSSEAEAKMYEALLRGKGISCLIKQDSSSGALRAAYGGASLPFESWSVMVNIGDLERAKEFLPEQAAQTVGVPPKAGVRLVSAIFLILFFAGLVYGIFQIIQYFIILNR